jgi:hypothetical protein
MFEFFGRAEKFEAVLQMNRGVLFQVEIPLCSKICRGDKWCHT